MLNPGQSNPMAPLTPAWCHHMSGLWPRCGQACHWKWCDWYAKNWRVRFYSYSESSLVDSIKVNGIPLLYKSIVLNFQTCRALSSVSLEDLLLLQCGMLSKNGTQTGWLKVLSSMTLFHDSPPLGEKKIAEECIIPFHTLKHTFYTKKT